MAIISDANLPVPSGFTPAAPPSDPTTTATNTATLASIIANDTSVRTASTVSSVGTAQAQTAAADTTAAVQSKGALADTGNDSIYTWTFFSFSQPGDRYTGTLFDDSADYYPGQWIQSPHGVQHGIYVIEKEFEFGFDLQGINEGTLFITAYYDQQSGQAVIPFRVQQGQPSTYNGFGNEYDFALLNGSFVDFGFGGTNLI